MLRFLATAALCLCPLGVALAQGTISNGDATFTRDASAWDDGTPDWNGSPAADLTGVSSEPDADHVYAVGWAYRFEGQTREHFMPVPKTQSYDGAISEIIWEDIGGAGLQAVETTSVIDGDGPGGSNPSGFVMMRLTLTNLHPMQQPLTLDLFHAIDLDVGGSGGGDAYELVAPLSYPTFRIVDDQEPDVGYYYGEDADAYTVRAIGPQDAFGALDDDDVDNFDDAVPAGTGDYTAGMHWANRTIPYGETITIAVRFAINRSALSTDLSLSMQAAPDPVTQDTSLDYSLTARNSLDMPAPATVITFDAFAPAVQVLESSGCLNDPAGYPTCELGDLPVGDERQVTLRVVPGAGSPSPLVARATVASQDATDFAPADNTAEVSTQVLFLAPDLTVEKTNNRNGVASDIDGWTWTLALQNASTALMPASFSSGDRVLLDQMPNDGTIYGAASLKIDANIKGTIGCSVVASDLVCVATSDLSIPPGTEFSVSVPALPPSPGSYANPRVGGVCTADPMNIAAESNETNNTCADSVLAVDFMLFSDGFEE